MKKTILLASILIGIAGLSWAQQTQDNTSAQIQGRANRLLTDGGAGPETPLTQPPPVLSGQQGKAQAEVQTAQEQPQAKAMTLATSPSLAPQGAQFKGRTENTVRNVEAVKDVHNYTAELIETDYPRVVQRTANGTYVPVNIPPGWKMIPLRTLKYDPAPVIQLANGETYEVQSPPFVLIPASDATRLSINPRALQVLSNYSNAQADLMRQLNESLAVRRSTPIE